MDKIEEEEKKIEKKKKRIQEIHIQGLIPNR